MKIGPHTIGPGHPVYVIAEIGSNHMGSLEVAKRYILTAARLGAHCAKFQLYRPAVTLGRRSGAIAALREAIR